MRILIRGFGELCITAGLILLLFVTYELWGTGQYTEKQQDELGKQLTRDWGTTERVRLGRGMALLRIPRLGQDYRYVVIEGVGPEDLRKGPGHYPGTALPGQLGNFVVSGHRTTYSAPFNRVDELRAGDRILVDTRTEQLIYSVTGREIVAPSAIAVTAPVPFHPKQAASKRLITLTTCHPKFSAAKRMIIFGELTQRRPRTTPGGTPSNASGGI
ncbi:MAG: class E sortase [Actinomadura sp.]